jgi:hypothetical protein
MNDEASPRPWRVEESVCGWQNCIEDANGNDIGSCWYNRDRLRAEADAALIVDAVNERDHLRDIVRRLADLSESLLANYEYRYREDANSMAFVENTRGFLREARAAIGEDKE